MAFAGSAVGGGSAGPREPGPGSGRGSGGRSWVPLLAVCAGYFMVILDVTVINVAVPVIGRELSASLTGIQWITDGYTLVFAGLLLTGGALGDRLGNRRVFCTGWSCLHRCLGRVRDSRREHRSWSPRGWWKGSARR